MYLRLRGINFASIRFCNCSDNSVICFCFSFHHTVYLGHASLVIIARFCNQSKSFNLLLNKTFECLNKQQQPKQNQQQQIMIGKKPNTNKKQQKTTKNEKTQKETNILRCRQHPFKII